MTDAETLLREYGYIFVFAGSFLEGETAVGLSGVAAQNGYMKLWLVIATATLGAALGSQLWFHLGRWHGQAFLEKRPQWHDGIQRFERLLDRWDTPVILGFRFLYGMRMLGSAALGVSKIPTWKFTALNFVGALVWAGLIAAAGYYLGKALEKLLGEIVVYEEWVFLILFLVAAGIGGWKLWQHRRAPAA